MPDTEQYIIGGDVYTCKKCSKLRVRHSGMDLEHEKYIALADAASKEAACKVLSFAANDMMCLECQNKEQLA